MTIQAPLVVKVGGARGIGGAALLDDLAHHARRRDLIVVHGGSDRVTALQERLGRPARFLTSPTGQVSRHTDREELEAFAMATGLVNRELVEGLLEREVLALGLSGLDGRLVEGERKAAVRSVEDGRVRIVRDQWTGRPTRVDRELLDGLRALGRLPVVAPLLAGPLGELLTTDADRLAASLAAAAGGATLVILTNVPGLLEDVEREDSVVPHVAVDELDAAMDLAQGRMRKKLLGATEALAGGVARVILADARVEQPLTSALAGRGTVIGAALDALTSTTAEPTRLSGTRQHAEVTA